MFKKIVFTLAVILVGFNGIAQNSINDYKYILVPTKFEFSKVQNQYQLNALTKFLFNKYGYEAYFPEDDLPQDLKNDRCLALTAEVLNEKSGMFKTKVEIVMKDCFGVVVMTSQVGESRLKKFDRAYNEALRGAFETFQDLDYKYEKKSKKELVTEEKVEVKETEVTKEAIDTTPVKKNENIKEVVSNSTKEETDALYYAQKIKDGYQIVDAEPKVIMILLETSVENVFMVKDKNAIVYKENNIWIYFENEGTSKIKNELAIKF